MDTYVTVHGNLTADPTQRSTASGVTVVGIRVASSSRRFDKASGEFKDGEAMFIAVSCWRALGGHVFASLRKGDSVIVHGRLLSRTYDDQAGNRRTVHEIDAVAVGPDLARCAADLRRPVRTARAEQPATDPRTAESGPAGADPTAAPDGAEAGSPLAA
jgi:single-strand DNA-binding protein